MPKRTRIDFEGLAKDLRKLMASGPLNANTACRHLGISQSTFSRNVTQLSHDIFVVGRASKTIYALKREIPEVGHNFTIYKIDENGKTSKLGELLAIYPKGFYFEGRFFDDLPYFMDDLRPNGFLGRLIPRTHPDMELPKNINDWSANDCLRYLTRYGNDLIGNLILGDRAFERYLNKSVRASNSVQRNERDKEYPKMATQILQFGDPGSSAGGEQPKFPAVVEPDMTPVLVKFSPKVENNISQRRADLLICEHLCLGILNHYGQAAARSELIFGGGQVFLETIRFDRIGQLGRKGLISLNALDVEFAGRRGSWTESSKELLKHGLINKKIYNGIRWRELFGHLIGNTDMHLANVSFYFQIGSVVDIAPAYDMLPMLYAPQNDSIVEQDFDPPLPSPANADIWRDVWGAAGEFWGSASSNSQISPGFQKIAQTNLKKIQSLEHLQNLLP